MFFSRFVISQPLNSKPVFSRFRISSTSFETIMFFRAFHFSHIIFFPRSTFSCNVYVSHFSTKCNPSPLSLSPQLQPFYLQPYLLSQLSYAFSTTQSLESFHAIKTGQLLDLSEQQLVDCSDMMGNAGCDGGLMSNAFDYLVSNNGACASADYPYRGNDSPICTKCKPVVKVKGYTAVQAGNDNLAKALLQNGPIAVALAATDKMQFYNSGVFDECVTDVGLNQYVFVF